MFWPIYKLSVIATKNIFMVRIIASTLFFVLYSPFLSAQQKVSFYSEDGLKITADLYLKDYQLPFILLFHQGESSRGEFSEIAPRLMKLDYNCLAVDLRAGEKMNYIVNETATRARENNYSQTFYNARKDIKAAMEYVKKFNNKDIILFGSSYSASLCLIEAASNPNIKAVIAFSPGEFFRPEVTVKDSISGLQIPLFIYATSMEFEFVQQMVSDIHDGNKKIFTPLKNKGEHGAKTLFQTSESSNECWLELLLFFKNIRYN